MKSRSKRNKSPFKRGYVRGRYGHGWQCWHCGSKADRLRDIKHSEYCRNNPKRPKFTPKPANVPQSKPSTSWEMIILVTFWGMVLLITMAAIIWGCFNV